MITVSPSRSSGTRTFLDVGLEGDAVDRAVQDERRDGAAQRQAADKCRRFPMAMRNADPQAFAAQTPAIAARHVG